MTTITADTITGREIIVTVETHGNKRARKFIIDGRDEEQFFGLKTGKTPVAEGTPALGGVIREPSISDIRFAREDFLGRFSFGCQEVKTRQGMLEVNESYRTLDTYEVTKVELVNRDKIVF